MAASTASPQTGRETIARAPETALIANGGEEDEMPAVEVVTPAPGKRSAVAPPPGETGPKPADPGVAREETDTRASSLLTCAVCGASFETRKGLSSHARSHLRQLGVVESESSGAPIDLLYELTRQRGALEGAFPAPAPSPSQPASARKPQPPRAAPTPPPKKEAPGKTGAPESEESEEKLGLLPAKAVPSSSSSSSSSTPSSSSSSSPVVAGVKARPTSPLLKKAPISSLLPASSPLRALDHERGAGRLVGSSSSTKPPPSSPNPPSSSSSSGALPPSSKPFWAPQDTDAPLNLTVDSESNKDIVCKLCGAWFETRKGLSSHARAHLRHFGVVDAETKGSPIDYLNELIKSDDFKHRADDAESSREAGGAASERPASSSALKRPGPSSSSVGAAAGLHKHPAQSQGAGGGGGSSGSKSSGLLPLPPKRLKTTPSSERSAMQVYRLSGGELTPLSHGETVKEIGCEFCGEYFENRKGLSSHARSHLRQMGITEWSVNGSPIDTLREIIKRRGLPCALPLSSSPPPSLGPKRPLLPKSGSPSLGGERDAPRAPRSVSSPSSSPTSPGLVKRLPFSLSHSHPPTARKVVSGGGLAAKLKPEPVHLELGVHSAGGSGVGGYQGDPLQGHRTWTGPDTLLPLNLAQDHEPTRDIRCEFCGEYFENRKGLSSHARSHLRQMGITEWSVNGSPIDTLREIMRKKGAASGGSGGGVVVKREPGAGGQAWDELAFPHPRPFRKSPLSLLHSGSRLLKPGLGSTLSLSPPTSSSSSSSLNGKAGFLSPSTSVSQQLGKRAPQDEAGSAGGSSERHQPHKPFSPPSEFSFRGKTGASPDKHGMDASCELCGFYFENRKALASHARAHLRQFGVTEWCVNGSPIETLSAWMRSKPHKVAEMHRSYLQGGRPFSKKVRGGSLSSLEGSSLSSAAQRSLSSPRPSLGSPLGRRVGREVTGTWSRGPERTADGVQGSPPGSQGEESSLHFLSQAQAPRQHGQVARSELNVRSPRGFERRPPKHQAHEGGEAQSRPPQPPRARTVPALVPKPPSTPLVKLVGNIYSLKCRFCEVEFQGPLSVQEDWVRHLQQHILDMNFSKPEPPAPTPEPPAEETPPAPAAQAL